MQENPLDFAVLGHQENWSQITRFVNGMRHSTLEVLPVTKIKEIFPHLPPMSLFDVKVTSQTGRQIHGVYIETFIAPDELSRNFVLKNMKKIKAAMQHAEKIQASVVGLGGFTSIILEGNVSGRVQNNSTVFTTGNTLTAALIIEGIESAASARNVNLSDSKMLIIGATGDIGSVCSQYFYPRVHHLVLCARNQRHLQTLASRLSRHGERISHTTDYTDYLSDSDIILCVASTSGLQLSDIKPGAIICDAGYPKNIGSDIMLREDVFLFHGGMGYLKKGYEFHPDYTDHFYAFPTPYTIHGCLLEAMVLAFERMFVPYSQGRGHITLNKIEQISTLARRHGILLAPFYNSSGLLTSTDTLEEQPI